MNRIAVGLVAGTPGGAESLALAYLASALTNGGHTPHVLTYGGSRQLEPLARELIRLDPPLVGVSLPSGHASIDAVAFILLLRTLGHAGHITVGGAWATLSCQRILESFPQIDSVVRYDGEIPIVELANRVANGADVRGTDGVCTREGGMETGFVEGDAFLQTRPLHDRFRRYAGVPSAKISAVRGCFGKCKYCGLAAVRKERKREARAAGLAASKIRALGIGGMRRRPAADVAQEMAELYHEYGVRFFHFVDENHLPADPEAALVEVQALARARGPNPHQRRRQASIRCDAATRGRGLGQLTELALRSSCARAAPRAGQLRYSEIAAYQTPAMRA